MCIKLPHKTLRVHSTSYTIVLLIGNIMGSYNPLNKNCFETVLHFGWVLDWIQDTGLVTLTL